MLFSVTIILCSLLLRPGLGLEREELPDECFEALGDRELEGDGVRLHDITCTTNHIEVKYEYQRARETLDTLSILYTCQHLNGTQILDESRDSPSYTLDINWMHLELVHGIVCDIYTCYKKRDETQFRTTPVTCTVVDTDICTSDCIARGAVACQIDASGSSRLGYGCVCASGYIWNTTHCENVNECNTTDPDHQHNCSTGEGYQCLDLEGSFLCVNCTEREEWNGTSCVPLDDFSTTAVTSTDSPQTTTYSSEPPETGITETTTNTPTAYSLAVSDRVSITSTLIPTAVGVLSFLVLFAGLLIFAVAALYLYRKRKSKKRSIYSEMNNYYPGYPCYPGYIDKIDENFNPIDNIDPVRADHLSIIWASSIASRLNRLWEIEEPDSNTICTTATATTTLQHHASTSRPCHLHLSSERSSTADLSPSSHHRDHSIDSCIEQSTIGEQAAEQSMNSVDCSASLAREEIRDNHPQRRDLDDLDDMPPTDLTHRPHRCSCVTMESAGSMAPRETYGCHFRQSSVSTLESEWMHYDLTGSGLTDTSGYIKCMSKHDHSEDCT